MATPRVGTLRGVIFDAVDPPALAAFWASLLGMEVDPDWSQPPAWYELRDGDAIPVLGFQPVDPDAIRTRIRIDVEVDDLVAATERVEALGGKLVAVVHFQPGEEHRTFTDPEGNEFNLVLPFPAVPPSKAGGSTP